MRTSLLLLMVVALAACSPAVPPSPSPAAPTAAPPSASSSPVASAPATAAPSVGPSTAFATCDLPTWHNTAPSGRLIRVSAATAPGLDTLTFQFAPGGGNPGTPVGDITIPKPPFTQGASGQPMSVAGDQFLQVRFEKMDIVDAAGNEIYNGSTDIRPAFPGLQQAIQFDSSEGVVGWYVGLAAPTCVTVAGDPAALTIMLRIVHP